MKRSIAGFPFFTLLLGSIAFGQMQLNRISSRAVREGFSVQTSVDSLLVDMRVNSGIAISKYTLVLTPGTSNNYFILEKVDTLVETQSTRQGSDSIEMTMSFQLPSDFVADSMWLWIEGEPVAAQIQDRALASQQYQQIVGVRKDPALLETWGRGYYNLRIFPASSMKSRKITIEFHHTFNDDSVAGTTPLITACLPVTFDSTYVYSYYSTNPVFEKRIGFMQATFTADDRGEYTVDIPGLGAGTFSSSKTLTLSGNKIFRLQPGTVASRDPSGGNEFLWVGRDAKSQSMTAGITAELSDATMRFEDEPDTRIIIIDLRNSVWDWNEYYRKRAEVYGYTYTSSAGYVKVNIWERAQKYAVLALQQYLKEGQKFNVLFGGKTVQQVFDAPAEVTAANIDLAIKAIIAATASSDASTEELLNKAVEQAPEGIAVLISDLIQPPTYYTKVDNKLVVSDDGTAYTDLMTRLVAMVKKSSLTLFTIDDNYQLLPIALESGGFRLSGILNRYNIAYRYEIIDGRRISVPQLPALFGSSNYSGIRDLSITSDLLTDIASTIDGYYNGYSYYYTVRGGAIMIDEAIMAKKSLGKMALPSTYNSNNALVRVAGKLSIENSGKPVAVTVRGKTGGLWFSCAMTTTGNYSPTVSSYQPFIDPQWAFRTSEQLVFDDYIGNAAAVKTLGREYHIVTRQTSLLALEPDMKLWEDTSWQQEEPTVTAAKIGAASEAMDASYRSTADSAPTSALGSGVDFDGISLEDILLNKGMAVVEKNTPKRLFSVTSKGNVIWITAAGLPSKSVINLRLYDLKGRLVACKSVMPYEMNGTTVKWNFANNAQRLSRGLYTVHVSTGGGLKKIFRITLLGR
ncbi:MAG: hypothetical protein JW913_01135 [Chitinispirillaceae bacterium]|nr:hypothetical protein [Chitinispirillaceae bacterium]